MSLPVLSVPIKKAEAGNCWHFFVWAAQLLRERRGKGRGIFYGEQRRCPPCPRLPEKDFNLMPSAMVRQGRKLRKKNVYTLTVRPSADSLRFLREMGLDPLMDIRDKCRLVSAEERRSYLAGAFLGGGTVSRPQGDYHLELVTQSLRFAGELIAVMRSFKLNARMTDRKMITSSTSKAVMM